MNSFAKLVNGQLEYAPTNYTTPSGSLIVNFDKNETLMRRYGFKEVIDVRPAYDEKTQYISVSEYMENDTTITIIYVINNLDVVEPVETLEQKFERLEQELLETQSIVNDLIMNQTEV